MNLEERVEKLEMLVRKLLMRSGEDREWQPKIHRELTRLDKETKAAANMLYELEAKIDRITDES